MPADPVTERTPAIRRRLRAVLLFAAVCGLVILGGGTWQLSKPSAVGQNSAVNTVLRVGGGPQALAITRDGEIWVAAVRAGQVDELAEPGVGARSGGHRAIGIAEALVASPHQLIVYADASGRISSLMSPGMSIMSTQAVVSAPDGQSPLAISPDGKALYVASTFGNIVRRVSTVTGHTGPPIGAGDHPVAMTVSPDGRTLYVANLVSGITVINTVTWRSEAFIPNRDGPDALAISPGGAWLYVAVLDNSVLVVSTATDRVRAVIRVGPAPDALAITPDGRTIYVANSDNTVTPISTATRTAGAPIAVGPDPQALAVTPDGHYLYVANFGNNTVSQLPIDGTGGR